MSGIIKINRTQSTTDLTINIKEDRIQLQGWDKARRVAIVRRRVVNKESMIGLEYEQDGQKKLAFVDEVDDINAYEYSVLVTDLDVDLLTLFYHYRFRR